MTTTSEYTAKVIGHCKLLLRSDHTHSIPAIVARVKHMLELCGTPEHEFQHDITEAKLYAYRDFLVNG